jgi:iron complex outermembrane receptor protein
MPIGSAAVSHLSIGIVLGAFLVPFPASAQPPPAATTVAQDLKRLTIEELAELDVSSVSRRVERLSRTAAAISVVRQDDIRRSGAVSLAEAMRLADGLDVARYDGRTWAVSARGFTISTANKLLVLMDGRTLYSPLYSGTFWDVQDTLLADVDRIEVIRGPGGTIWGANAVNGVINIITRPASESRGTAALLAVGTEERLIASARYGARLGEAGNVRVFGKYRRRDANVFPTGESAGDELQLGRGGFRYDSDDRAATRWTLQGDAYRGTEALFDRDDTDVAGGNVLARWTKQYAPNSDLQLQAYYDRTYRKVPLQFEETRDTVDVDVQRRLQVGARHDLLVGGNFRVSTGRDVGTSGFLFEPERRTDKLFSLFAQDEVALQPGRISLIVGSKFERNEYTGLEVQPTIRTRWTPDERQTLWGAVSRAVRLPTRIDTDLRIRNPAGIVVLSGNEDFGSESVVAYEAGYRIRPHARVSLDFAAFANRYDDLRSQEFPSRLGPVVLLDNMLNAVTTGLEAAASVQMAERWRIHASSSWLHKDVSLDAGSRDLSGGRDEGNDPSFLGSLRSYVDLPGGMALDGVFRHVSARPFPAVPAYSELDLRLGWTVRPGWEVSLVGQNLLHDHHAELGSNQAVRYEFQRGVYARSAWRF